MINTIAWLLFATLTTIAALHLLWASGSTWPVANREQFARTLIGIDADHKALSTSLCTAVALLIFATALLPLWNIGSISLPLPDWCKQSAPWVLLAVFALRGISTYILPNLPRCEPFRTLDRRYFAPLCLLLAAGYLLIALNS